MRRDDFFKDLGIKLVALILSLIIWFHATTEKTYTTFITLPVYYSYVLPDSLIMLSTPPHKVRLRITAKGKTILRLKYTKKLYRVDIGVLNTGKNIFDMTQGNITGVEDLEILEVVPRRVLFLVDRYSTKIVYSVNPVYKYDSVFTMVRTLRISPRTVRLKGPRTILRTLRFVNTDTIDLDTLKSGNYSRTVGLLSTMKFVTVLRPESVDVYFALQRFKYDTVVQVTENSKVKLFIKIPDTLAYCRDSIVCQEDSIDKVKCYVPRGIILLNKAIKKRDSIKPSLK